jgi:hypothetical protein
MAKIRFVDDILTNEHCTVEITGTDKPGDHEIRITFRCSELGPEQFKRLPLPRSIRAAIREDLKKGKSKGGPYWHENKEDDLFSWQYSYEVVSYEAPQRLAQKAGPSSARLPIRRPTPVQPHHRKK